MRTSYQTKSYSKKIRRKRKSRHTHRDRTKKENGWWVFFFFSQKLL